MIRAEVLASDASWQPAEFLVDTGADRTVMSATVMVALGLRPVSGHCRLGSVGGAIEATVVETQIRMTREDAGKVVLRGQYAAVSSLEALT